MAAASEIFLASRSTPFHADALEVLPSGWLHVRGRWPRWDTADDSEKVIVRFGPRREYHWPPHRIREIRRG